MSVAPFAPVPSPPHLGLTASPSGPRLGLRAVNPADPRPPRFLDIVRQALQTRHYSRRTVKAYVAWIRRYILFHHKRHPADMGGSEVTQFLTALAVERKVAASTQNQALGALLFLYREVLQQNLPWLDDVVRARRPQHVPVVMTREEVRAVLQHLDGIPRLLALLFYGAGLRLLEGTRLRVQDVDFAANLIVIRDGKGAKDRVTMLPAAVKTDLAQHLEGVRHFHPETRQRRRHHLHESVPQRAVKEAVRRAGIVKHAKCHTFREASA